MGCMKGDLVEIEQSADIRYTLLLAQEIEGFFCCCFEMTYDTENQA